MILDTSALIAVLRREAGWEELSERLLTGDTVRVSAGTVLEAHLVAARDGGERELEELLSVIGAEIVAFDAAQAQAALEGFRRYGKGRHRAGLNFSDLFAYALATVAEEPLLYKGEDFARTDVISARI
jgi:ribonuclease VapC